MSKTAWKSAYGSLLALVILAGTALGNGIAVTNVSLKSGAPEGYVDVQFDVSWSNSWRATWTEGGSTGVTNWDAAWVFIKWRPNAGNWQHATLATSGHTAPAGSQIDAVSNGVGVFIYRSTGGCGNVNYSGARLRWNIATNGVSTAGTNTIDVSVQAIEMVYVAGGPFFVGSGGTTNGETGSFTDGSWPGGSAATIPFQITNEAALLITNTAGCLWGTSSSGNSTLSNSFPKGYNAFYCMKYEITQGQYTDFLNKLASAQVAARYIGNQGNYRQTIGGVWPNYTNNAPDRAANYVSWSDGCAYAAWAGLRPMTELEFEKACRGIAAPLANEYAWGNATTPADITSETGDGSGTSTANPASANCHVNVAGWVLSGPCRAGIFATATSTRGQAGASYWGIMELSGNVIERCVTVGSANGRSFTGSHGSGTLDGGGNAANTDWYTDASGAGCRGGSWTTAISGARVSDRVSAANLSTSRDYGYGWRAVRTAP